MEKKIVIEGGRKLNGRVKISGFKNAALPVLTATVLTRDVCIIENLPSITDATIALEILKEMGATVRMLSSTTVEINTANVVQGIIPPRLTGKMRGSTYFIGAELGRFGRAHVGWPGGCNFGDRPIDQHIKGFEALGAKVTIENAYIDAYAPEELKGAPVYFDTVSVGATVNVILAAVMAKGTTVIENAAREPHIVDLANFLNTCGASISGAGTDVIKIKGVESLHGCTYAIIPDMIEAGTYMIATAATRGTVCIENVIPKHLESISAKLEEMGVIVEEFDDSVIVRTASDLNKINVKTLPYPGFPTDLHPQMSALLCTVDGVSLMTESIFENRFRYADELRKMKAHIKVDGKTAVIEGGITLAGAPVRAVDLRAGAALIIAGIAAEGTTVISDIDSIERGYDDIVGKMRSLGADIKLMYEPDAELHKAAN